MDDEAVRDDATGCIVCRARKVRCDRSPPTCQNCARLGVKCPGYSGPSSTRVSRNELARSVESVYEASGVEKRRVGACDACRKIKSKCSKTRPSCHRCLKKTIKCLYTLDAGGQPLVAGTVESPLTTSRTATEPPSDASLDGQLDGDVRSLLGDRPKLRFLATLYFDRIAPVRCLGFIHKPSFMRALDQGTLLHEYPESLVYIIAALGQRMYDQGNRVPSNSDGSADAVLRDAWAKKARTIAMDGIDKPTTSALTTLLLVCEYAMRTGQQATLFVLVACCYRVVLLLRLNAPERYLKPPSSTAFVQLELELRLVWACYIFDSLTGTGTNSLLNWKDKFPEVPLPSPEADYLSQTRSVTCFSTTLASVLSGQTPRTQLDLAAHSICLFQLRTEVLRLIRQGSSDVAVWQPESAFLRLLRQLEDWYEKLPEQLLPTAASAYIHKELHTLGAVFGLHFTYHSAVTDLTRISLPGYHFPLASAFQSAPAVFRRQCQQRCRFHADEISRLIHLGFQTGQEAFDDPPAIAAAYEATKIQIVHTATATANDPFCRQTAEDNMRHNLQLLATFADASSGILPNLLPLLSRFSFHRLAGEWAHLATSSCVDTDEVELTGSADVEYQSKFASFRMAVAEVSKNQADQSAPDKQPNSVRTQPPTAQPPAVMGVSASAPAVPLTQWSADGSFTHTGHEGGLPVMESEMLADHMRIAEEMSTYISWDMGWQQ